MNISGKTALVVVDFQGGDLDETDAGNGFWTAEQVDNAKALVANCRAANIPIVWIQEVHKPHLTDIGRELDGSEGPHCIEGDPRTEIVTGLGPIGEEFLVQKRRYSGFFATSLDLILRSYDVDSLILIGGFTDICVLYTSVDAHQHDYFINVVTDLVSGSSGQASSDALKMIHYLQNKSLVSFPNVMEWLTSLETAV